MISERSTKKKQKEKKNATALVRLGNSLDFLIM